MGFISFLSMVIQNFMEGSVFERILPVNSMHLTIWNTLLDGKQLFLKSGRKKIRLQQYPVLAPCQTQICGNSQITFCQKYMSRHYGS